MCQGGLSWVHLVWHSLCILGLDVCVLLQVRVVFSCYFFQIRFLLLFLSLWTYIMNTAPLNLSFLNILFSLYCLVWLLSIILSFRLLISFSTFFNLLTPFSVFFISVTVLFSSDWFFIFSIILLMF